MNFLFLLEALDPAGHYSDSSDAFLPLSLYRNQNIGLGNATTETTIKSLKLTSQPHLSRRSHRARTDRNRHSSHHSLVSPCRSRHVICYCQGNISCKDQNFKKKCPQKSSSPAAHCATALSPVFGLSRLGTDDVIIADCVKEGVGLCRTEFT